MFLYPGIPGCTWKYWSISSYSPAQPEIKDNGDKWMSLIARGSIHLVMTLEEDTRCLCVWLLYYVSNFPDSPMKVPRSSSTSWDHLFLSVFSSEVLAKITSKFRSKLPTAACWSRGKKRENCEANLLYVESDFGTTDTTDKSFTVFFARWGVKFDRRVKISAFWVR